MKFPTLSNIPETAQRKSSCFVNKGGTGNEVYALQYSRNCTGFFELLVRLKQEKFCSPLYMNCFIWFPPPFPILLLPILLFHLCSREHSPILWDTSRKEIEETKQKRRSQRDHLLDNMPMFSYDQMRNLDLHMEKIFHYFTWKTKHWAIIGNIPYHICQQFYCKEKESKEKYSTFS